MRKSITLLLILWAAVVFSADFNVDFQRKYQELQAETLFVNKQYEQAREAFDKLAATSKDPAANAMWQGRSAIATGLQENQYEKGMEMARAIGEKPYSVQAQIELMTAKKDYKGLTGAFGAEDIAAWPERAIPRQPKFPQDDARCCALFDRGCAYIETGDGQAAAKDLDKAEEFALSDARKFLIWRAQARTQSQLLKNEEKTFEANFKIAGLKSGGADYYRGVIGAAGYLSKQGKYDEALQILDRMHPYDQSGSWLGTGLLAVGRTLAAAGRTDKAVAAFRQVADDKGTSDNDRCSALMAIGDTFAAAGQTDKAVAAYKELLAREKVHAQFKEKAQEALKKLQPAGG
ncbi:MAG: tetratricopeptide repeat protein [Kiritimatiellia bacterium]